MAYGSKSTGNWTLREFAERSTPAVVMDSDEKGFCRITAGHPLHETFVRDQLDSNRSVTDLHLVGEDGHVPVHRYILMASSSFLKDLLENHDPSELAVVHLPEVKLNQILQIVSLVYAGKAVIQRNDEFNLFSVMKSLGISTNRFQFRSRKPTDEGLIPNFRYYKREDEEDEMEETFVNEALIDDAILTQPQENSILASSIPSGSTRKVAVVGKENVNGTRTVCEKLGPKVVNKSAIEKAESDKFLNLKVELPDENSENDGDFPCLTCNEDFSSEKSLYHHLVTNCASHLQSKLEFKGKQCLVCKVKFPSHNVFGLIKHVEGCQGKKGVGCSSSDENFNEVEVSETLENTDLSSNHLNSSLTMIDDDEETLNQSVELTSEENSPVKSKKKRRRRRIAAYNLPKRKPKKRQVYVAKAPSEAEDESVDVNVEQSLVDEEEQTKTKPTTGVDSLEVQTEVVDDKKDETPSSQKLNTDTTTAPNPNMLLEKFGLKSMADVMTLSPETLRVLFRRCSICGLEFEKLKDASKCLRNHGCRLCFVCLQVLPNLSNEIDVHTANEHQTWETSPGKVNCPLCCKEFEYKLGLPSHIGNFNCMLMPHADASSNKPGHKADTVEIPKLAVPIVNLENSNPKEGTTQIGETLQKNVGSDTPQKDILLDGLPVTSEPVLPTLVGQDEEMINLRSTTISPSPLTSQDEISSCTNTTHPGHKEKQIINIDTENSKEVQDRDRINTTPPPSCSESPSGSRKMIKRRAVSSIPDVSPHKNLRDGRTSLSLETQQQPVVDIASSEPITEKNTPEQENIDSEPGKKDDPAEIPSGRRFLTKMEINGEFFDIFCNIDNPKKRIAIPAKPVKES